MTLIRADRTSPDAAARQEAGCRALTSGPFHVLPVPADHYGVLREGVAEVARWIGGLTPLPSSSAMKGGPIPLAGT